MLRFCHIEVRMFLGHILLLDLIIFNYLNLGTPF